MERVRTEVSQEREKTFRVAITALKTNPAYLTLFCLGLMGGPVVAGAMFYTESIVPITATISWVLFLLAGILVVAFVESRRIKSQDSPFKPSDQLAQATFLKSKSASNLSGRWHVIWYEDTGRDRKPYDPDPNETAVISTNGPGLFIHSYDPSTKMEYWFFGRKSDRSDISMIYWSKPENNMLTGVLYLEVDNSFEAKGNRMNGWWRGRTRNGVVTTGEVELVRYGHEELL